MTGALQQLREQGNRFEDIAADWLQQQGLRLLQRNYRTRCGEIDLIMLEQRFLVFVEVRSRANPCYGGAAATVDWRKQRRILRSAEAYLKQNTKFKDLPCRFDVLAFEPPQSPGEQRINWIKDAFTDA